MKEYSEVYFLYAGDVSNAEVNSKLLELSYLFPKRVYCIEERLDLPEIMKRCCLYLMTYPINGGLMFQQQLQREKSP